MKTTHQIFLATSLVTTFVFLAGCKSSSTSSPTTAVKIEQNSLPSVARVQIQPELAPNTYTAILSWPSPVTEVRMTYLDDADSDLSVVFKNTDKIILKDNYQGQILLNYFDKNHVEYAHEKVVIQFPTDKVISGYTELEAPLNINIDGRLFLINAQIYTKNFDVKIEARELIIASSGDSIIANYPENSTAEPNTAGRSGAHTNMKFNSASGNLVLLANAENGGPGQHALTSICFLTPEVCPVSENLLGCAGGDAGQAGSIQLVVDNASQLRILPRPSLPRGGLRGESIKQARKNFNYPTDQKYYDTQAKCAVDVDGWTDGKNGRAGEICIKNGSSSQCLTATN